MTKLCFKYEQLDKSVIPRINGIVDELLLIKEETKNLDIPFDFKYYNYLKNSEDCYNLWINDFKNLVKKIDNLNKDLNDYMDDVLKKLNNIDDFVYKK